MLKRLTTRLVLSQLLVIGAATATLAFVLLSLVQSYFVQAALDSLRIQARLSAQMVVPGSALAASNIQQSQLPSASNSIQSNNQSPAAMQVQNAASQTATLSNALPTLNNSFRLSLDLETRVRIVNARGVVESDSAGSDLGQDLSGVPAVKAALANQESAYVEGDTVIASAPLRRDNRVVGAAFLSQPLRDVSNVMADLRSRLLISAAIALIFAALVGVFLARGIARPVRQLTTAANELAVGKFDYPLDTTSQDELGDLARAFRRMSSDLQHMLQARTDLVANVSHELRTPLTAIKGLVETLRAGAVEDTAVRDAFLASIEQQTDRLTRLVNDLLILSRADSQALALQMRPTDLTALARSCVLQLTPRASAAQVTLKVEGPAITANMDPDRIQQVLVNLLDNAIRFSPPGGTVTISISQTPESTRVAVSDQGPGMSEAEQARVFERFYRGDKSRSRQGDGGAGLGLSIAEALVRAHGGEIGIHSQPGHGTSVWFTLPEGEIRD
jgi:signal transduction histidine kinase